MKAFHTCASHPTTVILFYGSGFFSYLHSRAGYWWDQDNAVSMFHEAVTPKVSPITNIHMFVEQGGQRCIEKNQEEEETHVLTILWFLS